MSMKIAITTENIPKKWITSLRHSQERLAALLAMAPNSEIRTPNSEFFL